MFRSLRIKNLRLFSDLEIGQLKRINLLAGKNNSGKTTVLEAMFLLAGGETPHLPLRIKDIRGAGHQRGTAPMTYWNPLFHGLDMRRPIEISSEHASHGDLALTISLEPQDTFDFPNARRFEALHADQGVIDEVEQPPLLAPGEELADPWALALKWIGRGKNELGRMHVMSRSYTRTTKELDIPGHAVFVSRSSGSIEEDAVRLGQLRALKQGDLLTEALRRVEPRLKSVEDISASGTPMIWADVGLRELAPLSAMGEGMTRVARIVLAMSSVRGGAVLVDEIESGIHHSILGKVWAVVAASAQQFDVQVFATTHSFECVVAAHEALNDEWRFHRLERTDDGSSRCVTFDTEDVEAVVRHGLEVR